MTTIEEIKEEEKVEISEEMDKELSNGKGDEE